MKTDDLSLEEEVLSLSKENAALKRRLEEIAESEAETRKKIEARYLEAEQERSAASYAYQMELKSLKAFSSKWRRVLSSDRDKTEIAEIIDLLQGFLSDVGVEDAKRTVEKVAAAIGETAKISDAPQEFEFDLDAAINPPADSDLESLCKELGVFRG
ncbi:MAG: hypothetical protein ILP02_02190 [Clostridia bacterium]|nr:hypothetical protein [Clostridia bacterium]